MKKLTIMIGMLALVALVGCANDAPVAEGSFEAYAQKAAQNGVPLLLDFYKDG